MTEASWDKLLEIKESIANQSEETIPELGMADDPLIREYHQVLNSSLNAENKRPVVFGHLAQTLDGRIACLNGDSKWIGNEENLLHAHRMRALCDCVLVGKQTWESDKPQLNVRHVKGNDPLRVVLEGHSTSENSYAKSYKILNEDETGLWNTPQDLMHSLTTRNVRTIFLEGGGKTLSYFLQHKLIDFLHLHIATLVLGSGRSSVTLPEITSLNDAICFKNPRFVPMADHIMFSGEVSYI